MTLNTQGIPLYYETFGNMTNLRFFQPVAWAGRIPGQPHCHSPSRGSHEPIKSIDRDIYLAAFIILFRLREIHTPHKEREHQESATSLHRSSAAADELSSPQCRRRCEYGVIFAG